MSSVDDSACHEGVALLPFGVQRIHVTEGQLYCPGKKMTNPPTQAPIFSSSVTRPANAKQEAFLCLTAKSDGRSLKSLLSR
mmetsp:Transcript_44880/g.91624  ORF Transcript_44880/g.91624 Transcript_44880/m.91624 type:complete len:81 (-) Transcript_44880:179-421(-)